MFTGIIEDVGRVESVRELGGGKQFTFSASFADDLRIDESVAVNGVCLTVVGTNPTSFDAVAIEETLSKSSLGHLTVGSAVNLERAMPAAGRLDGHIVQGHVDGEGSILEVKTLETSREFRIGVDPSLCKYLVPKGSVALDGISLTVASLDSDSFVVAIIPHTYDNTNVQDWAEGSTVNIEFDMIGKYVIGYLDSTRGT